MWKRERDEEKERERERKKRRKRKYGQAKLKHAKRGILSCGLSVTVFVMLVVAVAVAYANGGTTGTVIGGVGMSAFVLAVGSLYLAMKGFKEREKDYLTCKIGMAASILLILGFVGVFCRGLF